MPKFLLDIFDMLPTGPSRSAASGAHLPLLISRPCLVRMLSEAAHALKQELETLSSWTDGLIPSQDDGEMFDALEVKGLEAVEVGGEEYEAAASLVKASVASVSTHLLLVSSS